QTCALPISAGGAGDQAAPDPGSAGRPGAGGADPVAGRGTPGLRLAATPVPARRGAARAAAPAQPRRCGLGRPLSRPPAAGAPVRPRAGLRARPPLSTTHFLDALEG